jgi:outer membrane receptor protein involved in Fe transport
LENSAGGISPGTIVGNDGILADSKLIEAGMKFELLDDSLFSSFSFFKQERKESDIAGNILTEQSKGFEAELNWVIDDNWAVTGAATVSKFKIKDPDPDNCSTGSGQGEFVNIAPTDPSISFPDAFFSTYSALTGVTGYGGIFRALNASCLPELADGYEKEGIPNQVYSLFLTYTSDETAYGTFGATFGGTYVGKTGTLPVADEVRFPDYTVFRLAAFAEYKNFSLIGTIDNLFDKRYFVSSEGTFQNVSVHPGTGRIWRLTGKVSF